MNVLIFHRYLVLRKKVDGKFLVHTLIFNNNDKPDGSGPSTDPSSFES